MKHNIYILCISFLFLGCKSNPNKAESVQTQLETPSVVSGTEKVGLKNGEMVVLDKVQMAEKLRDLQNRVYSLEDQVYGTRKLGTLGLYGDLKSCLRKLSSKQYGGSGAMTWTEPLDRVTDKEDELKIGIDEKKELVGVSEEYLKDRIQRFNGYKIILLKRSDEFSERIETCTAELGTKTMNASEPSKVMVTEAPKVSVSKVAINEFMCGYVRTGASLENFMINSFARGWLSLSDFQMSQNLIGGPLKDVKGESRANGFLFNGWKMVFDKSPVTAGDLLNQGADTRLVAWAYDHKANLKDPSICLPAADGVWNH